MRLITLNVRGANKTRQMMVPYQVAELMSRQPDVVALSEVAINRFADYHDAFQRHGLMHVLGSVVDIMPEHTGSRSVGTLIASRFPCMVRSDGYAARNIPWPERLVSAMVESDVGPIEIDVAYIPYYYQGDPKLIEIKIRTLNGLYESLAHPSGNHRIVCGDFNLPYAETVAGGIVCSGKSPIQARLHEAECRVLLDLAAYDLHDVFRGLHGYTKQEYSWHVPSTRQGFRLDHVLASKSLNPIDCQYLHHFRAVRDDRPWGVSPKSLTDHSALEVVFDPEDESELNHEDAKDTKERKE